MAQKLKRWLYNHTMTSKDPLPQTRHLATAIPGPKSLELIARRKEAVSAGLGMAIPAFIERGEGAIPCQYVI